MYQEVNFTDFDLAFKNMGRDNSFSYAGKRALFDYLEDFEAGTGEKLELDVIGLCCDYSEITEEDEDYEGYLEGGDREEFVVAVLENGLLVREG